jgi:hypothetical protein
VKDKVAESKLEKLIHDMDIPFNRKTYLNPTKLRWLQKNMGERNKNNPYYAEAMQLVEKLIADG